MLVENNVKTCVGHNFLKVDFAFTPVLRVLTSVYFLMQRLTLKLQHYKFKSGKPKLCCKLSLFLPKNKCRN